MRILTPFKNKFIAICMLYVLVAVFACVPKKYTGPVNNEYNGKTPKYVFLFIGDGMAASQVAATEIYAASLKQTEHPESERVLQFTTFPAQGLTTTHDASSFITDSASAGTAIATGNKTLNGVICMDIDKKNTFKSIAYKAKEEGMKVGIISSVSIDHATPASFYAAVPSRKMMYEIGLQMADSNFDYFAGGSMVDPDGKKSKMDNKPGNLFDYAKKKGYTVTTTKDEFDALKKGSGKIWAVTDIVADAGAMLYEIDRPDGSLSLRDMTAKGIELLDNTEGFFIMVEGGKIDWAAHANDARSVIDDVTAFDDAVKVAVDFAKTHPKETLIVVTGDHDCGGMALGFAGTGYNTYFTKLKEQKLSFVKFSDKISELKKNNPSMKFEEVMPLITENFGLSDNAEDTEMGLTPYEKKLLVNAFAQTMSPEPADDEEAQLLYGTYDPLTVTITHVLNRKAGIGWTSYVHTGIPVPTYASGVGQDLFNGYYDNTDIYKKMASIMKI